MVRFCFMFNKKASSQDDHVACSRRGNSTSYDYQRLSVQAISVHLFLPYQCIHYKKWPNHGLVGRRYSTRSDFENGGPVILILAAIIACIRSCVTRGDGPKASINLCEKYHAYAIYIFPPCHYIGLELKFSVSSCSYHVQIRHSILPSKDIFVASGHTGPPLISL